MKKILRHPVGFIVANIIILIIVRYINIIVIFLDGIGPEAKYSIFDYLPALIIQCLVVVYLYFRNGRKNEKTKNIKYFLTIVIIIVFFFAGHFGLLPQSILPI